MEVRAGKVTFANNLRGLAALVVVVSHYFGVFWLLRPVVATFIQAEPVPETVPTPAIVTLIELVPLNLGAFGVALFFIISGFVVPFSLARRNAPVFLLARIVRLLPPYVVSFTLSLGFLALSCWFYGGAFPFSVAEILVHYLLGLRDIIGSRNIDGVIWTLEIEIKFYLLCALIAPWLRQADPRAFLAPALVVLACAGIHLAQRAGAPAGSLSYAATFSGQFLVFMFIGVAAHFVFRGRWTRRQGVVVALACFLAFAGLWAMGIHSVNVVQVGSYGVAVALFAAAYAWPWLLPDNRVFRFMADISYPLYAVHAVAGYVLLRLLLQVGVAPLPALLLTTAAALGVSWLLHRVVEQPSQRWAQRIGMGRAGHGPSAPAS